MCNIWRFELNLLILYFIFLLNILHLCVIIKYISCVDTLWFTFIYIAKHLFYFCLYINSVVLIILSNIRCMNKFHYFMEVFEKWIVLWKIGTIGLLYFCCVHSFLSLSIVSLFILVLVYILYEVIRLLFFSTSYFFYTFSHSD
jgi:hypothetical protein